MRSLDTLKQYIRPFCKLGKYITYLKFGLSVQQAFHRAMTHHILIPVRIFFILGCQIAPSRESRTHVLKFLARTLYLVCIGVSRGKKTWCKCIENSSISAYKSVLSYLSLPCLHQRYVKSDRNE